MWFSFCVQVRGQTEGSCVTAGWIYKRRPALPLSPLRDRVLFVHIFGELITW